MAKLCLLFDSDGTLVDSEWLCNQALAMLFARYDVQLNVADLMRDYRGGELQRIFNQLAAKHCVTLAADSEAWYRAKVAELFEQQLQPVAGVPELLAWVHQQGWPCAVVVMARKANCSRHLAAASCCHFLTAIFTVLMILIFLNPTHACTCTRQRG